MKTRIVIGVSLIVVVLAMANLFAGQAQRTDGQTAETRAGFSGLPAIEDPGARFNPLKIALLHWYQLNRTTHFQSEVSRTEFALMVPISGLLILVMVRSPSSEPVMAGAGNLPGGNRALWRHF